MSFVLRASHSRVKSVGLESKDSVVTGMNVTVEVDYIDDDGNLVTTVTDTMPVWDGMSPEMKAGVQAIVDAMSAQVDAKYFN